MTLAISKRTAGILGGAMLLFASACATGTRAGGATGCDFTTDEIVLRSVNANANMLQMKLLYLDKEDYKGLREAIDAELDSELLAICVMTKDPSFGSGHSREVARTILGRIAKYRNQRPPSSLPDRLDADTRAKLQRCFDEALASQDK